MMLFFGVFLALGSAFTYFLLVRPVSRVLAAKHWPQTRCPVISSRVQSHSSGDGLKHRGNLRDALRDLYDQWAERTEDAVLSS